MGFYIGVTFDTKKDVQEFRDFVNNKINDEQWKQDIIESYDYFDEMSLEFTLSDRRDYIDLGNTFPPQAFKWDDGKNITSEQFFRNCAYNEWISTRGGFDEFKFLNITDFNIASEIWRELDDYYTDSICTSEEIIEEQKSTRKTIYAKKSMLI